MQGERRGALLVIGVLVVSAVLGGIYGPSVRATSSDVNNLQDSVKSFTRVLSVVEKNYATPVDTDHALYSGAIPGMLRVLDPHSSFFDPRAYANLREDQRGRYYGVGMTIVPRDNFTYVLAPMPGAPAFRAGIRPGDVIMAVDGKSAEGLSSSEVADMLKGPKGTVVHITMKRVGYDDNLNFTVTRDEIPKHSVDIAFRRQARHRIHQAFRVQRDHRYRTRRGAQADLDATNLDGLVLDLRGNPGGLLNEAVAVSDMFLDKNQLIVSHHGRASQERRYYAVRGNRGVTVPLVVIVNGGSASASEIVTGAIQDHDRGLVVGEQSFGKGLVQTVSGLSENTGLALTTARYYTPSGRLIQRDYKDTSLYDYLYNHKNPPPTEVKLTDSGRQVTGGGGITPDVPVAAGQARSRSRKCCCGATFSSPIRAASADSPPISSGSKPEITKDFVADDNVMKTFTHVPRQGKNQVHRRRHRAKPPLDQARNQERSVHLRVWPDRRLQSRPRRRRATSEGRRVPAAGARALRKRPQDHRAAQRGIPARSSNNYRNIHIFQILRRGVFGILRRRPAKIAPVRWAASSAGRAHRSQR